MSKTRNLVRAISIALSVYIVLEKVREGGSGQLRQLIRQEVAKVYLDSLQGFKNMFRSDGVLIFSVYDQCYKTFYKDIGHISDGDLVFVQNFSNGLKYTRITKETEIIDFANAHPQSIYFTVSAHSIKAVRTLKSTGTESVYLLEDFYDILEKPHLHVLFNSIYKNLFVGTNKSFEMSEEDITIKCIKAQKSNALHIDFKGVGLFSRTTYTGELNAFYAFYVDMKYIFTNSVAKIRRFMGKRQWLETYITEVVDYLYEQKMIFTRDFGVHPELVTYLFPFKFVDSSARQTFKDGDLVRGGICFTKVFEKQHLVRLIDTNKFKEYGLCADTLFFTSFVQHTARQWRE
jgi:hypothetical protein